MLTNSRRGLGTGAPARAGCGSPRSAARWKRRLVLPCTLATLLVFGAGCPRATRNITQPVNESLARQDVCTGQALLARSDQEGAIAAFERAVDRDPRNAAAQAELGRLLAAKGDFEGAADHYREALKTDPMNLQYALAPADLLQRQAETSTDRQGVLQAAVRAYAHAHWVDPASVDALAGLGRCLRLLGEFEAATEALCEAIAADPKSASARIELAAIHYLQGDYAEALVEYDRVLEVDPENCTAHNACGVINLRLSRDQGRSGTDVAGGSPASFTGPAGASNLPSTIARERAVAHFRKSLQIDPDQPRIRVLLEALQSSAPAAAGVADAGGGSTQTAGD